MKHTNRRTLATTRNRVMLGSLIAVAACSGAASQGPGESVGSSEQALLATTCTTVAGVLQLKVGNGEIGYASKTSGCTTEPCVYFNAKDSSGNLCVMNSTTGKLAVIGAGTATFAEKMVFDFSNGLFGVATSTTPLVSVVLDGPTSGAPISKVMVIPPTTGGNMALAATAANLNVLDINTLTTRGATQYVDISLAGPAGHVAPAFEFNGGAGNDFVTGDLSSWSTIMPTGWATAATLQTALGPNPSALNLTLSGGPGNDTFGGGAGTNTLIGGPGNDTFLQGTVAHAETLIGGDGVDTVDYTPRAAAVFITPASDTGLTTIVAPSAGGTAGTNYTTGDVVAVTGGTGQLLATLTVTAAAGVVTGAAITTIGDGYAAGLAVGTTNVTVANPAASGFQIDITTASAANDGAQGEGDSIAADVEVMIGGAGNDILNAHGLTVASDVVLMGGAGSDSLTGGLGNDDLCGGAGNDTFYENAGNDNLVGGAGIDTADFSTGTGVVACLNAVDQAAGKTCATQNGGTFGGTPQVDLINATLAKVCPRATLHISQVAGFANVAPTTPGAAMAVDVENVTGNPTAANTLRCGTLACTAFGGTGSDTIVGSPLVDQIFGLGGADTVTGSGGNDLIDLTHPTAAGVTQTVDCTSAAATILLTSPDVLNNAGAGTNCSLANIP